MEWIKVFKLLPLSCFFNLWHFNCKGHVLKYNYITLKNRLVRVCFEQVWNFAVCISACRYALTYNIRADVDMVCYKHKHWPVASMKNRWIKTQTFFASWLFCSFMVHKFTACFIITSLNNNNWLEPVVFHRSMQTRGMTQFCFFLAGIWVVFVLQLENKCFIQLWVDCDCGSNIF